jgi:hypothetical protein
MKLSTVLSNARSSLGIVSGRLGVREIETGSFKINTFKYCFVSSELNDTEYEISNEPTANASEELPNLNGTLCLS